jgi:hypothetical protein
MRRGYDAIAVNQLDLVIENKYHLTQFIAKEPACPVFCTCSTPINRLC